MVCNLPILTECIVLLKLDFEYREKFFSPIERGSHQRMNHCNLRKTKIEVMITCYRMLVPSKEIHLVSHRGKKCFSFYCLKLVCSWVYTCTSLRTKL